MSTVGGGKDAVRAVSGYIPQKLSCTDSRARGIGVARKYIISASAISLGINASWSTYRWRNRSPRAKVVSRP